MRFSFASLAAATPRPLRAIERADRVAVVAAPSGWTDVQVEAWLDWADQAGVEPGEDALDDAVKAAVRDYGLAATPADEARGAMLLGVVSPARPAAIASDLIDLSDPGAAGVLCLDAAQRRASRMSAAAVLATAEALGEVTAAVDRCEGPAGDCRDPARNPALARAAHVARRAGAADADILRAIAGESFEAEPPLPQETPPVSPSPIAPSSRLAPRKPDWRRRPAWTAG